MLGFREVCPAFTIQKKIEREKQESIIITQNRDLVFAIENPLPAPSLKKTLAPTNHRPVCILACLHVVLKASQKINSVIHSLLEKLRLGNLDFPSIQVEKQVALT
jgi:hypothetical protein